MSWLPDLARLPAPILESRRAVVWNYERRDNQLTKVPYVAARPTERAAVDNPATWSAFRVAVDTVADGKADGCGVVLGERLNGIDLDKCRHPKTGEITADAWAIIRTVDSYSEISVSGTGIHILAFGELPPGGRRRNNVELYSRNRYFIVTGQHLAGTPTTIHERTAVLTTLYATLARPEPSPRPAALPPVVQSITLDDATLLVQARAARNGAQFTALWNGDVSAYGDDESAADLALANLLAFWTGRDAVRMDQLFRQSGLMRAKWDSRRGDSTYGQRTIDRAIADCANTYEPMEEIVIDDAPDGGADTHDDVASRSTSSSASRQWPTLHPDAFVGLFGDFVRAVESHTEADPVALLGHGLVLWGNQIGSGPFFTLGADVHHLNENALFVGLTASGRKNMALSEVRVVLAEVDPDWARTRVQSGLSSGEGLIFHVRDAQEGTEPIREKGRIVGYQPVLKDAGVTDKRLAVLETEFAKTLRVSRRETNTLSTTVRQAWDTGDLATLTRHDPVRATGAHVSIIGHITPRELREELKTTDMASGFINRFLILLVRRSRYLPHGGRVDPATHQELVRRFALATDFARHTQHLTRDGDADALWASVYPVVTRDRAGLLGDLSARAPAHILRVSMLYALADRSPVIGVGHLKAALAVWEFAEASARLIFGRRVGHRLSDYLLSLLRSHPAGLTRTQIRDALGRNRHVDEINEALERLRDYGLVRVVRVPPADGIGRPITVWIAEIATT